MRIPGSRTRRELILSMIPSRVYFLLCVIAIITATSMTIFADLLHILHFRGSERIAQIAETYAATFRAFPLWFLIGGSLTGFANRVNTAIDHFIEWRKSGHRLRELVRP